MVYVAESDLILFLCSPHVTNLDDMAKHGLFLSDIPLHDATRDLLLLSEKFSQEYELAKDLEILTDKLQYTYRLLEDEKSKTDQLLYSVLPPSVANELRHKRPVAARKYETATIMFSGIAEFTSICAKYSSEPMKIVHLLNDIYVKFDRLTDKEVNPKVYKVETVGDKYMVVSGVPEPLEDHARCICQLALEMKEAAEEREKMIEDDDIHVTITIGIHTGEVVSGVIGNRVPRYCLFGNTVNLASRTETTGIKGRINISESTYLALQELREQEAAKSGAKEKYQEFKFDYRGEIAMKGKATPMKCWLLSGA